MALNASRGSLGTARRPSARAGPGSRRVVVVAVAANRTAPRATTNDDAADRDQQPQQSATPAAAAAAAAAAPTTTGRRPLFAAALAVTAAALAAPLASPLNPPAALAFEAPPAGYRLQLDRLDGYSFFYPQSWQQVTTSGNDVFFRNPRSAAENLFVDLSSPSSSRYDSVADLGTPQEAAARLLDTLLNREFMSTRLGVKREGEVLSAVTREGPVDPDTGAPRVYLDVDFRIKSYASRSPYVVSSQEMMSEYGIEWDRRLMTTLGVANRRLYSLRLQTDYADAGGDAPAPSAGAGAPASTPAEVFAKVRASFSVREVEPV